MRACPEAYSKELDRLLVLSEVPAFRPQNEYYAVRKKDGALLAAGVCWSSGLHPGRKRFYIAVEELYQRRGLGTMIFERMRADHPGIGWQGSAELDNEEAEWWLRGLGFEFSYRSYWLDGMIVDLMEEKRYSLNIRMFHELSAEQKARLFSMAWTDYATKWARIDPLNEKLDADGFIESVLGEADERVSCCLMNGSEIDAYILFGAGTDDWTVSVRQTGQRLSDREEYSRFLTEAVNRAFEKAGGIIMEAESFDEDALALMHLFGGLPDDSYDTYVCE